MKLISSVSSNPDVKSMVSEISDDTNVVVARTFSNYMVLQASD